MSIAVLLTSFVGLEASSATAEQPVVPVVPTPQRNTPSDAVLQMTDGIIVGMAADVAPTSTSLTRAAGVQVTMQRPLAKRTFVTKLSGRRPLAEVQRIAARIAATPGVAYAVPNRRMRATYIPSDPAWEYQWDLNAPTGTDIGANLPGAWNTTKGTSDVVVAVIDTGITSHPDLSGQTLPGYDFVTNPLIANDGNGRDSNPADPGDWITSAETAGITDGGFFFDCGIPGQLMTSSWHGTHVSGTIAARASNGMGISGVAPFVKVLPVRVLGKCGGENSDVIDGMRWAAGLGVDGVPPNPNPASVLNISLGGSGACDPAEQSAIDEIRAMGVAVVVAAGNDGAEVGNASPASCSGVISVGATDRTGDLAFYSNFSGLGADLTLSAPGGDTTNDTDAQTPAGRGGILSTLNGGATSPGAPVYTWYDGTSMATPHVSGVAALVKSVYPNLSPAGMATLLTTRSRAFKASTKCAFYGDCGSGILDANSAVTAARATYGPRLLGAFRKTLPLPGAVGQSHSTTITWSASTGATGYEYCLVVGTATPCTSWVPVGNRNSVTLSGLLADTVYAWQVRATGPAAIAEANAGVRSSFSTASATTPDAPTALEPTYRDSAVALRWTPPVNQGGAAILDYEVEYSIDGGTSWTPFFDGFTADPSTTVGSLTNGLQYVFHVAAVTDAGTGPFSATSAPATPFTGPFVPLAASGVGGTPGNASVSLTWTAPSDGGDTAISDYAVQYSSDGGLTWTAYVDAVSTATATTVPGLTNGTAYIFRIAGVNDAGEGVFSVPSRAITPRTTPARVAAPTAKAAAGAVWLTWAAPSNGGSRLLTYRVQFSTNNGASWSAPITVGGTTLSRKFTGLTNGQRYWFRVAAANGAGVGTYSVPASAVAVDVPKAPSAPAVSSSFGRVNLSWNAPANNGAAITDYVVQYSSNNGVTWTTYADGVSTARTATLRGLPRRVTYRYRIAAVNSLGRGAFSAASVANKLR